MLLIVSVLFAVSGFGQVYSDPPFPEAATDAFGRLRVSNPANTFDAQFTYGLQPLLFDQILTGAGTAITHDATNRNASISFTGSLTGSEAAMQSFEFFRYQPGKSQLIFITFNMKGGVADVDKYACYCDGSNGIRFRLDDTTPTIDVLSDTDNGDQSVTSASWNLDPMDGSGPSKVTLDLTTTQILVIDFEALYVGRVRVGFNIDGKTYYVHEFKHANIAADPYMQTANLPIRVGMTSTATVTADMDFICSSVISEGGFETTTGFPFSSYGTVTAANGSDTHLISIQPKTTFNSITNRTKIEITDVEITVTGNNPVLWKLCIGQALTATTETDINTTYSGSESVAGTLSGSPLVVLRQGTIAAAATIKTSVSRDISLRVPITLSAAGTNRDAGRLTLLVQGIGATSTVYGIINFKEIR